MDKEQLLKQLVEVYHKDQYTSYFDRHYRMGWEEAVREVAWKLDLHFEFTNAVKNRK